MGKCPDSTFLAAAPGIVVVRIGPCPEQARYLALYRRTVESLGLPGITRITDRQAELWIEYDRSIISVLEVKDMLEAAQSAACFAWGERGRGRTHIVPVAFGGSGGPDLTVAAILLGVSEKALVRRLSRTGHIVRALTAPAASPLLEAPAKDALPPIQATRRRTAVPSGTLTLSNAGITITTKPWHSDELVIGRLWPSALPPIVHVGDKVRFQAVVTGD